ncbi:hypothetical protein JTE90_028129 [Oedothorax gibbosus]|uniref:Signal transducing adapter molecule 1 n=1 Tax=Oedothorax gibbosus TaxID=931172 RepID=A0AAV6V8R1_9ARAC|nr:hypothetical protein JTE90_028129 [Oedothorax gibbosus]
MLKLGKSAPFEDEIEKATNENNLTEDWALIMQICDNAINYQDGAKFCLKAIMKKLHHNVPRVVLQALTLLDACVKNCDRRFLLLVASNDFITEVRKLLGKMHPSAAMKIKELIQKWSLEEFKDDPELGIIPSFYYKLKSEGAEFPSTVKEKPSVPVCTDPDAVSSQEEENDIIKAIEISLKDTGRYNMPSDYSNPGSEFSSKSLPEPIKVRTLYDFDAEEDNELTIKAGEIVMVLDNSDANWWKGSNHRGEGLFPANFVSEDLEAKPEEISVQETTVVESIPETTFSGEVKINEEKIETVICWLNEIDPSEEIPDSADMLRLEDEVYKMGPLIEGNLQSVDKRLAMLNLVNEKIMASFDLFHSLSDNFSTMPSNMKFSTEHQAFGTMRYSQQIPPSTMSTMHPNMQAFQSQPIMYIPVPTPSSQFPTMNHQVTTQPMPNVQPQASNSAQSSQGMSTNPASNQSQVEGSAGSDNSENKASVGSSMPTLNSEAPTPVMIQPYPMNAPGGFYIPQPMGMPYAQLPPNSGSLQTQGFAPGSVNIPNFMPIPFPPQQMGQYVPFQCYYPSSSNPAQMNSPLPPQNPSQEVVSNSQTSGSKEENTASTSSNPQYSSYSNDLQTVSLNASASNFQQSLKQEPLSEPNNFANGDTVKPLEPLLVSKQM